MRRLTLLLLFGLWAISTQGAPVRIAVASNFAATLPRLLQQAGYRPDQYEIISGATAVLHSQIVHGAPFDLFLAANEQHPRDLIERGLARPQSYRIYARGQLILMAPQAPLDDDEESWRSLITRHGPRAIAMANPATAPYGQAAAALFSRLHLPLSPYAVQSASVAGAFHYWHHGQTPLALVAASHVYPLGLTGYRVPQHWYPPIRQAGVVLSHAAPATEALFLALLAQRQSPLYQQQGYLLEATDD